MATTGAHWKERGMQKALSKLAHARVFNDLHKRYRAEGDDTTTATLLSTEAPGAMSWVTFNDQLLKADTLPGDIFRTAMRFSLGFNQPILVEAAANNTPCGHCNDIFPTPEHYQTHALTITDGTDGGSTYNTHNRILEAVANCARAAGAAYSVGATQHGIRNHNANCRLGTHTNINGAQTATYADIAFLDMPQSAFNAQRVYGDVTHRAVVGIHNGTPTPKYLANEQAGAVLQHAAAEKQKKYDEALRGRQNEKVTILAIETGGRMHKDFYRLIDTLAKLKADSDAGPLDGDTDPAQAKHHKAVLARAKAAFTGRIQAARAKCVAERIMHITRTRTMRGCPA